VLRLVIGEGMLLALIGLGWPGRHVLCRAIDENCLVSSEPIDPAAIAAVRRALAVALLAATSARRATKSIHGPLRDVIISLVGFEDTEMGIQRRTAQEWLDQIPPRGMRVQLSKKMWLSHGQNLGNHKIPS